MAKIGYARVSTRSQRQDSQVDDLSAYGVDRLFIDQGASGKHARRPELDKALAESVNVNEAPSRGSY